MYSFIALSFKGPKHSVYSLWTVVKSYSLYSIKSMSEGCSVGLISQQAFFLTDFGTDSEQKALLSSVSIKKNSGLFHSFNYDLVLFLHRPDASLLAL